MRRILSQIHTSDPEFLHNREVMVERVEQLRGRLAQVEREGRDESLKRHQARGKLFVRERLQLLLDPGSPFLEIGALAA
ncbi:MAG: methylcrotonoyl-CoA carboxylase, partial [Planctomycetota bacterium]